MALVVKDRVRQTSTTAGTGTITLTGSVSGFQAFSVIGDGNTTYYTIVDPTTGDWEVGVGTYTLTGTTLSRDTVLESSNAGNLVSFGSAVKDVFCTYPAERSVYTDAAGTAITPATASTLGVASGGTGLSSYTANGIVYASGTTTLASSSGLTFNGTNFATTGSVTSAGASNSGNLTFTGTGNRITGDFSNATLPNRVHFQNSITNAATVVGVLPNGTATTSRISVANASDPTNSSTGDLSVTSTEVQIRSINYGTGTYLPMTFYTGGSERVRIDTSGNVGIGVSPNTGFITGNRLDVLAPALGTTAGNISSPLILRADDGNITTLQTFNYRVSNGSDHTTAEYRTQRIVDVTRQAYVGWGSDYLALGTGNTERMRIDSSGNVGIGTSSPSGRLDVVNATTPYLNITATGGSTAAVLCLNATSGGSEAITYQQALRFGTATGVNAAGFSERMRIDSSGNLLLNGTATPASGVGTLAIFNGTAPTGSVTNGIVLYAEDVSSSSELKVRDEAGNVTTLSPHNFSLIPEGPSEDMAWAYYSEKNGKRINVDMLKLARMVEKLTGEKLVYED